MSIAFLVLTLLFPPRVLPATAALPSTVARLSPRPVMFVPPPVPALPTTLPGYQVTATVYAAESQQTDSEPLITADNSRISRHHTSKHRWIALSRDLLKDGGGDFAYGDSVRVRGISPELDGNYIIHDTMNRRMRRTIDLLVGQHEQISGRWNNVRISKLKVLLTWRAS